MKMYITWSNGEVAYYKVAKEDKDLFELRYAKEQIKDIDARILGNKDNPIYLSLRHAREIWFED